jgi:hypothetical protein
VSFDVSPEMDVSCVLRIEHVQKLLGGHGEW